GRDLEKQVHHNLRELDLKIVHSLGSEWFLTSKPELLEILQGCSFAPYNVGRAVSGIHETFEEGISGLLAQGATVEFGMDPGSECVRMSINQPESEVEPE